MYDIKKGYELAKEIYAQYGIDVDRAIETCDKTPLSIHCWQGDDCAGFENKGGELTGGIQATGNYPGKARNPKELRSDLELALSFIPGEKKVNLHAIYLDTDEVVERNQIEPGHFEKWTDWACKNGLGLDFNPTFFSHEKGDGLTLSSADEDVRAFWIEHDKRCRKIGQYFSEKTGKPCVINHWIPDGSKEVLIDTLSPRLRLKDSYNQILAEKYDGVIDALECKLFGIGSEAYVAGSHEFYMAYTMENKDKAIVTFDTGHFHPTEAVSPKISSVLAFSQSLLLHVSRPVRWDSDHVVNFDDETRAIMDEVVRMGVLDRVHFALDYFDGSVNRVVAWVVGARNTKKALLEALLQPVDKLKSLENDGDCSSRLAYTQEIKSLPFALVWDYYCQKSGCEVGLDWLEQVKKYESEVLLKR